MKVLITTAGIGSRLGNITQYTNKALVKLGKLPIISHIINSYPKDYEFVILTGYYKEHIKDYLSIAHNDLNITIVNVENFVGPNSGPVISQLYAEELLQEPFIYNSCDTYIPDVYKLLENNNDDFVLVGSSEYSDEYDSFSTIYNNNKQLITNFYSKKESLKHNYSYTGVALINNYKEYWNKLKIALDDILDNNYSKVSDFYVYKWYLGNISAKITDVWYDTGNINSLNKSRSKIKDPFNILDKDDQSIFILDDKKIVIKFFSNIKTVERLSERYKNSLSNVGPSNFNSLNNFMWYDYINGTVFSHKIDSIKFEKMLNIFDKKLWYDIEEDLEFTNKVYKFYIEKTEKRLLDIKNKYSSIIKDNNEVINGVEIKLNINEMINNIYNKTDYFKNIKNINFHGDFIIDNMILDENDNIILIDWRDSFADSTSSGDMLYDLSKLNHNLIVSHDMIFNNNFEVNISVNNVDVNLFINSKMLECQDVLKSFIESKNINYDFIEFLTGLIWINMSPLHEQQYPFDIFLYYFGKLKMYKSYLKLMKNEK